MADPDYNPELLTALAPAAVDRCVALFSADGAFAPERVRGLGGAVPLDALRLERGQVLAIPLEKLPFSMPGSLVRCALLPRVDPGYVLFVKRALCDAGLPGLLRRPLRLRCASAGAAAQLAVLAPSWDCAAGAGVDGYIGGGELALSAAAGAGGGDRARGGPDSAARRGEAEGPAPEGYGRYALSVAELVPPAGSGVICLVSRGDDEGAQRWCTRWHDRGTAECSNIERGALRAYREGGGEGELHVHAQKSDRGFDISAARILNSEVKRHSVTVSSSAGAARLILDF